MAAPQCTGQFHVLCHEHHVEMRLTDIVLQTIAPKEGNLALGMTPRVTCPRDGQPMYLAELNPENGASARGDARNLIRLERTRLKVPFARGPRAFLLKRRVAARPGSPRNLDFGRRENHQHVNHGPVQRNPSERR